MLSTQDLDFASSIVKSAQRCLEGLESERVDRRWTVLSFLVREREVAFSAPTMMAFKRLALTLAPQGQPLEPHDVECSVLLQLEVL